MKMLLIAAMALLQTAFAANPDPSNTFTIGNGQNTTKCYKANIGQGVNNPTICYDAGTSKWQTCTGGVCKDVGSGNGSSSGGGINLLTPDDNAGFEDSTTAWTASGGSFTIDSTTPLYGTKSAVFNASASGQTLSSALKAYDSQGKGLSEQGQCLVAMSYKYASGSDGDYAAQVYDGTTVLHSQSLNVSTDTAEVYLPFLCPTSGSVRTRIISVASNPGDIEIDGSKLNGGLIQLGSNILLAQFSSSEFYGSVFTLGNSGCTWGTVSNQSFTSMAAVAACTPTTVKGKVLAPATKIPALRADNLPAGEYQVYAIGDINANTSSCSYIFSDGTQTTTPGVGQVTDIVPVLLGHLSYSSAGDRVIEVQATGTSGSGDCQIYNGNPATTGFEIGLYRYPTTAQTIVQGVDASGLSWSGEITGCTGTATTTSATYADFGSQTGCVVSDIVNNNFGSVSAAAVGFGPTWTPKVVGTYEVCASFISNVSASGYGHRIVDGSGTKVAEVDPLGPTGGNDNKQTKLCGLYKANSVSPVTFKIQGKSYSGATLTFIQTLVSWSIKDVTKQIPTPFLVNESRIAVTGYVDSCTGTNTVTNTAYDDFGAQTGCVWHDRSNSNFGTLTAASVGFGPTWTPSAIGVYQVCSYVTAATSSTDVQLALTDGSNTIITDYPPSSCVAQFCPFSICGTYVVPSTSPVTFKIRAKSSGGGTVTLRPDFQTWEIFRL